MSNSDSIKVSWAYLAGFTDGDGCISYGTRIRENNGTHHWFCVRWGQTAPNRMVLDAIKDFLIAEGVSVQNVSITVRNTRLGADVAELAVQRVADVRVVLSRMLPHLVLKQDKARETLRVVDAWLEVKERRAYKGEALF